MKMTEKFDQGKQFNSLYDSINLRVNQPVVQTRKRGNTISNSQKINESNGSNMNFRKSLVYETKPSSNIICPQNNKISGYSHLNSILKDIQLPKSNRASKNTTIEFSAQNQYKIGKINDEYQNKSYSDLKSDLCDLIMKKNKSREKYQDLAKQLGGTGSESVNLDLPPTTKKTSSFLEIPKSSYETPVMNLYKNSSTYEKTVSKSPLKEDYSSYLSKSTKFSGNQYQNFKVQSTTNSNKLRQTLNVTSKDFQINLQPQNYTIDSYKKQILPNIMRKKSQQIKFQFKIQENRSSLKKQQVKPKSEKGKVRVNDFIMTKKLGQGKFGEVFRAFHKETLSIYALKRIKKADIKKYMMEDQMMMEIKLQLFFNHSNILNLYAMFDDETYIYLLLEYMEQGTLYSKFKKSGVLKEEETSRLMSDVLKGVSYLHENNIAHRDIKPENIVISNGVCKLCDFGWSAFTKDDRRTTICGTLDYSAPQIIQGKQYSRSIDLWCMGVMVYELIIGKAPFYHINRKETMKKILNQNHEQLKFPNTVSQKAKNFISKFLKWQPDNRLQASDALKESFITDYNN